LQLDTSAGIALTASPTAGGSGTWGSAGIVDVGIFVESRVMDYGGLRFGVLGMGFHGDRTDGVAVLGTVQFVNYTSASWFNVQAIAIGYDFQAKSVVADFELLPMMNFAVGAQREWTLGPCLRETIDGHAFASTIGLALRWGNYGPISRRR
jgi:hypothetical protein